MHLLTLDHSELDVVHTALAYWATYCDEHGDPETAKLADTVGERTEALKSLTGEQWLGWVRHVGVGRWRGRPQG